NAAHVEAVPHDQRPNGQLFDITGNPGAVAGRRLKPAERLERRESARRTRFLRQRREIHGVGRTCRTHHDTIRPAREWRCERATYHEVHAGEPGQRLQSWKPGRTAHERRGRMITVSDHTRRPIDASFGE